MGVKIDVNSLPHTKKVDYSKKSCLINPSGVSGDISVPLYSRASQCLVSGINGTLFSLARQGGHHELAERLVEIQYELTDRLAFYLCGRKPGE